MNAYRGTDTDTVHTLLPDVVLAELVLDGGEHERADLEVRDHVVELREARVAEEDVRQVDRQVRTPLPVLEQQARQCSVQSFCKKGEPLGVSVRLPAKKEGPKVREEINHKAHRC